MKAILPYPRVYETTEISKSLLPQVDGSLGEGNFYPLLFKALEDSMAHWQPAPSGELPSALHVLPA